MQIQGLKAAVEEAIASTGQQERVYDFIPKRSQILNVDFVPDFIHFIYSFICAAVLSTLNRWRIFGQNTMRFLAASH